MKHQSHEHEHLLPREEAPGAVVHAATEGPEVWGRAQTLVVEKALGLEAARVVAEDSLVVLQLAEGNEDGIGAVESLAADDGGCNYLPGGKGAVDDPERFLVSGVQSGALCHQIRDIGVFAREGQGGLGFQGGVEIRVEKNVAKHPEC